MVENCQSKGCVGDDESYNPGAKDGKKKNLKEARRWSDIGGKLNGIRENFRRKSDGQLTKFGQKKLNRDFLVTLLYW